MNACQILALHGYAAYVVGILLFVGVARLVGGSDFIDQLGDSIFDVWLIFPMVFVIIFGTLVGYIITLLSGSPVIMLVIGVLILPVWHWLAEAVREEIRV